MSENNLPDTGSEELEGGEGLHKKLRWQLRYSDDPESGVAAGYIPLTSIGEMIWRSPPGTELFVKADEEEPAKTSRVIASLVHRLRNESGVELKVQTQTAQLLWTTYREPDPDFSGKRPPVRPVDHVRRMIIVSIIENPVYEAWKQRQEALTAPKRPPGRPPKPKAELEAPRRPRGRPKKDRGVDLE